jgi:hypothetical protein
VGSAISSVLGYFQFPNLPVGTYSLIPQLDTGDTAIPSSLSGTVVSSATVFVGTMTISNAFGTIAGAVTASSVPITTGVLIMAVAQPTGIGASPPTNNSTLRNGAVVYYIGSTSADGTYSLPVRGGATYNIAAWYTTFVGTNPNPPSELTATATVSSGGSATVNFGW